MGEIKGQLLTIILTLAAFGAILGTVSTLFSSTSTAISNKVSAEIAQTSV